jgi:hypothetical protein
MIQNREEEVEGQLGRETTNDTGYNKIDLIINSAFIVRHPSGICRPNYIKYKLQKQEQDSMFKTLQKKSSAPHVSCAPSGDEGPTVYKR